MKTKNDQNLIFMYKKDFTQERYNFEYIDLFNDTEDRKQLNFKFKINKDLGRTFCLDKCCDSLLIFKILNKLKKTPELQDYSNNTNPEIINDLTKVYFDFIANNSSVDDFNSISKIHFIRTFITSKRELNIISKIFLFFFHPCLFHKYPHYQLN